ncbi:MAG: class I SAM-dependent methyltransferase [Thermoplasmatales archaeon]|jgi:2-polyprenyl-3-methyl-5-hydroxy-6-metoxy-1,4-benzoquinol methylase|nr:class I SAM-dependent methyltransferase [Thermoplasmatales archaeon]
MTVSHYNKGYYNSTYGEDFVEKQQNWLEDYFHGRDSGFTTRINYMLKFSNYIKGKDLLDLGCGVGTFALLFAQRGYNTVGLDISEASISNCQKNLKTFSIKNAQFVLGDCSQDYFGQNRFDSIIAADIIEHLPPAVLKNTLINCYRWLRPGGTFIIHTFPTTYYYMVLNKGAFLLLPIYCIPKMLVSPYIWLSDRIFDMLWALHSGRTHSQEVATSGHCNPPHPFRFRKQLEDVGFEVIEYKLLEEVLSRLEGDSPRYQFCKKLIRRHEIIRPSISAVVQKPRGNAHKTSTILSNICFRTVV